MMWVETAGPRTFTYWKKVSISIGRTTGSSSILKGVLHGEEGGTLVRP